MIVIRKGNILRSDYPLHTGRKLTFYLLSVYVMYSRGNYAILYLWKHLKVKSRSPKNISMPLGWHAQKIRVGR